MDTPADSKETLVVVSKLKRYIKEQSGLNTSSNLMEALSDQIRDLCNLAIQNAKNDGRKTVMARDLPPSSG